MSKYKIGQTVDDQAQFNSRDCHHVASILVRCDKELLPGQDIKVDSYGNVKSCAKARRNAIVDPFVMPFKPGTLFWALIEPSLVSGISHTFDIKGVEKPYLTVDVDSDEDRV